MVRKDFEECILLQQKGKRKSAVIGFTPSRNPKMFQDFSVHEWLVRKPRWTIKKDNSQATFHEKKILLRNHVKSPIAPSEALL